MKATADSLCKYGEDLNSLLEHLYAKGELTESDRDVKILILKKLSAILDLDDKIYEEYLKLNPAAKRSILMAIEENKCNVNKEVKI